MFCFVSLSTQMTQIFSRSLVYSSTCPLKIATRILRIKRVFADFFKNAKDAKFNAKFAERHYVIARNEAIQNQQYFLVFLFICLFTVIFLFIVFSFNFIFQFSLSWIASFLAMTELRSLLLSVFHWIRRKAAGRQPKI